MRTRHLVLAVLATWLVLSLVPALSLTALVGVGRRRKSGM